MLPMNCKYEIFPTCQISILQSNSLFFYFLKHVRFFKHDFASEKFSLEQEIASLL